MSPSKAAAAEPRRPRVLVLSADVVGAEMAGAGIRAFEIARALAPHADVTLAAPAVSEGHAGASTGGPAVVPFDPHDPRPIATHLAAADAIVSPPLWPRVAHAVRRSGARLIFDLYVPEPLETIEHMRERGRMRGLMYALSLDRLDEALRSGHHLICASEKQRDLWLGALLARRLISADAYDRDPSLRSRLDVVPFGVPTDRPRDDGPGPRERFPQIGADDRIVLWNGGLWGWFDAPAAIRAFARVADRRPETRLVFMGASSHPAAVTAAREARAAAKEVGLLEDQVLFNDGWVPYGQRASWLLQADCALSAHRDHLETRFAFRTRLLDCFWAGLPVVCTAGDDLGDRIERDGLGATAPAGDVDALARALERVLDEGKRAYAPALARAADEYGWPELVAPLRAWIAETAPARWPRRRASYDIGERTRTTGYRIARPALDAVGLRGWPKL